MTEQTQIEAFAEPVPVAAEPPPAEPAVRVPLRDLEDGQRVQRRLRGPRARAAPQAQRRALAAAHPRRRQRHRRGGLLGGRRGAATRSPRRAPPSTSAGVFEVSERWGAEDQAHRRCARPAATSSTPRTWPPGSEVSVERLEGDLRELLATVQDPQLRELLDRFFGERLGDLGALPRRAGGQGLPPGLPPRPARAHALGRPGGQRRRHLLPRHRPRRRRHRRAPARHRQDRGLQRRSAGDRPHRRRPPAGRDPARLLHWCAARSRRSPASIPAWPRRSSTSSSATTARSSTARRSSPAPARPCSST